MQSVHEELKAWKEVSERLSSSAIWQTEADSSSSLESWDEWRLVCERLASRSLWTTRLPRPRLPGMSSTFAESDDSTSAGESSDSEADGHWGDVSSDED